MEQTVYFHASKKKAALLLAGSIGFVLLGYWLRNDSPIVGWASMLFFGLGIPVSLFILFSKRIYLLLDNQGFEMASPIKTVRIGWQDVVGFDLVSMTGAKMIAIHYREGYKSNACYAERFVRGVPRPLTPAAEVWINPPENRPTVRTLELPRDTKFVPQLSQSH